MTLSTPSSSKPNPKTKPQSRKAKPKAKAPRSPSSYTPVSDALKKPFTFTDTEISEGIQRHSLVASLIAAISRQRRSDGEPLANVLCALLIWPLLKVHSLHCFCAELCQFFSCTAISV